ncbi:MAG: alpha/beta fold hydrolase, partial [Clostridia bacterium]|nr:alpha/beta fold hydrolase [Clostridia bacterium]
MAIEVLEKRVLSSDGVHELVGKVYLPEGESRGLFHVVHGMTEHIGRYDGFMREIAQAGYTVFGYDHLGHGLTAEADGSFGFIAHKDGWKRLVGDVYVFGAAMAKEYGEELPRILMGHSMGSFIVRLAAAEFAGKGICEKLIIMGTGGPNPAAGAGQAVIGLLKLFKGDKGYSSFVEKLAFGTYNSHFADEHDEKSWLTKDVSVREAYVADKYCTFRFTVSAMGDLIKMNRECNKKSWPGKLDPNLKILLVSGSEDPVGDYGKGVSKVFSMLIGAGADAKMKLYDNCRHEILNDTSRAEVISDILGF